MMLDLLKAVESFVGLAAWRPAAGLGTGTAVSISFGPAIPRRVPLTNPFLDAKNRAYDANYVLFVQDANWYLRQGVDLVCASETANHPFAEKLHILEDKVVVRVELSRDSLDCAFVFDAGLRLEIEVGSAEDSYSIFVGKKTFSVGGNELRMEEEQGSAT